MSSSERARAETTCLSRPIRLEQGDQPKSPFELPESRPGDWPRSAGWSIGSLAGGLSGWQAAWQAGRLAGLQAVWPFWPFWPSGRLALAWPPGAGRLAGRLSEKGGVLLMGVGTLRHLLILSESSACQVPICATAT